MSNPFFETCFSWPPSEEERPYEKPSAEIIEVLVEKGYADSTTDLGDETW